MPFRALRQACLSGLCGCYVQKISKQGEQLAETGESVRQARNALENKYDTQLHDAQLAQNRLQADLNDAREMLLPLARTVWGGPITV